MTVEDLTLSKVGPSVEGLLKLMQSGGAISWAGNDRKKEKENNRESENESEREDEGNDQVQLAYLGSLEEMRIQLQRMCQFYQDDINVLLSLTTLMDRIDEALNVVSMATHGFTREELGENADGTLSKKEEESILLQSSLRSSIHHSLIVSSIHNSVAINQRVLGISGLLDKARLKAIEHHEEEEEDEWDTPITEDELSQLDSVSLSPAPNSNLRQSFMENITYDEPVASSSSSRKDKGKSKRGQCEPILCKICYDDYDDLSLLHFLENCDHTYCKECLGGFLTTQIISGGVLNLGCPHPQCEAEVDITDIYAVCNAETLEKYERFVVLAALRADPNVRWCPMPNCSAAIHGPPKDNTPWIQCGTCKLQVCFACGDERHDPAQCGKQAKDLIATRHATVIEAERQFEEWHQGKPTDVKPCPKCKAYIEKNQGCNHMTCQACKHQYCWLCLAQYESNHFSNILKYPDCNGKQYWTPPAIPDSELQSRYNWIYFPPNYQYAGVDAAPLPNADNSEQMNRIKTKAKKVGIYVGVGVAVATLGIPAAIIGGPIYGVFKLHKALKAKRIRKRNATLTQLYL